MEKLNEIFKVTYENGISSINMVFEPKTVLKFISYQYEMLANNTCKGIMSISSRQKDGQVYLYCDITSRLSLAQYLKGRRISKADFIGIISSIIETISGSRGYLLYERCFALDKDYIYIKPGTCDVQLAYVPFDLPEKADTALKKLLLDIIMSSDFDEVNEDNFLQRILSNVKSETFCLNELRKLLKEISYTKAQDIVDFDFQEYSEEDINDDEVQIPEKKQVISIGWGFFSLVLSQLVIFFLLFSFIKSDLLKDILSKYSVCSVIVALDILAVMKFHRKLPKIKKDQIPVQEEQYEEEGFLKEERYSKDDRNLKEEKGIKGERNIKEHWSMKEELDKAAPEEGFKKMYNKEKISEDATMLLSVNDLSIKENKLPYACLKRNINGVLEEIQISKNYFTLGRLEGQVDYVCKSNAVGRVHAEITYKDGSYYVKDLNSRNGTFINNERLDSNKEYMISNQDRIAFANYEYSLVIS